MGRHSLWWHPNYAAKQVSWFIPGVVGATCPHGEGEVTTRHARALDCSEWSAPHTQSTIYGLRQALTNHELGVVLLRSQTSAHTSVSHSIHWNASVASTPSRTISPEGFRKLRGHLPSAVPFLWTGTLRPRVADWLIHAHTAPRRGRLMTAFLDSVVSAFQLWGTPASFHIWESQF